MTERAQIRQADIARAAKVAKAENVAVRIEAAGVVFVVLPDFHSLEVDSNPNPESFATLDQWQAWREKGRAREG